MVSPYMFLHRARTDERSSESKVTPASNFLGFSLPTPRSLVYYPFKSDPFYFKTIHNVQFSQTFIVCFFIIAITSNVKRYFWFWHLWLGTFFGRSDGFIYPVIPVWFPGMEALARETLTNKRQVSANCMTNEWRDFECFLDNTPFININ